MLLSILFASPHKDVGQDVFIPRVAGDWDGQFAGTIVERSDGGRVRESQTDSIVFFLRQSGSEVTGEVVFGEGWPYELRVPLAGIVAENRFTYRAERQLDGCSLIVEGETTLNPPANEFSGEQTQSNCEGKAVGRITAIKKSSDVLPDEPLRKHSTIKDTHTSDQQLVILISSH